MVTQLIPFTKMHALGNDFMLINNLDESINVAKLSVARLANRHTGVGFDQLLLLEKASAADFFCRIFNADGTEAEQCGNGLRCIARYIHENKLYPHHHFNIATRAGVFPVNIKDYDHIQIEMGAPQIEALMMALEALQTLHKEQPVISVLSFGNPHAILKVNSLETLAAKELSTAITKHEIFKTGANVGFMQIINPNQIRLRTFERGVGETQACGSNACAAAIAGIGNGWLNSPVKVEYAHGSLDIEWAGNEAPVYMTGPASQIYAGNVILG